MNMLKEHWRELTKQVIWLLVIGLLLGFCVGGIMFFYDKAIDDSYSKGWIEGWQARVAEEQVL